MSHASKRLFRYFEGGLLMAAIFMAAATGAAAFGRGQVSPLQRPGTQPLGRPQPIQQRSPIPFKPLVVPDPKTGKVPHPKTRELIAPDTVFTLPNGKQTKIGEYYRELNELEQRLNQTGHSLRETPSKKMPPPVPVKPVRRVRGTVPVVLNVAEANRVKALLSPQAALQAQKSEQARRLARGQSLEPQKGTATPPTKSTPLKLKAGEIQPVNQPGTGKSTTSSPPSGIHLADPLALTQRYKTSKVWNGWTDGDPSKFYISVGGGRIDVEAVRRGDIESDPSVISTTSLHAEGSVSATILNNSFDILRMTGDANAPDSQPADIKLDLYVFGALVYELNKQGIGIQDSITKPLNFGPSPFTQSYQIGPFDVTAQEGINGEVGIKLSYGLFPTNAYGEFDPYVHTSGYATASIGLGVDGTNIASAGVKGSLTFLNEDVTLGGKAALEFDPASDQAYFDVLYHGDECWHALDGCLDLFVQWVSPCFFPGAQCGCDIIPVNFCDNELDQPLVCWSGDQGCITLFSGEDKINLPIGQ
jgi:hypothetical protein